MIIKQVSVFLENSEGRLSNALLILKNKGIDIRSLSLADTNDYGMLRLIVDKPEEAIAALKEGGLSAHITEVLSLEVDDRVGALADALSKITEKGLNIEYMYDCENMGEAGQSHKACMIIKISDLAKHKDLFE
ncbi:MAG: amino acid-binding protein [Lachnospiraceae bacterium]|nr:amino acid-binding protein [Lachnospiraceae bacterium]